MAGGPHPLLRGRHQLAGQREGLLSTVSFLEHGTQGLETSQVSDLVTATASHLHGLAQVGLGRPSLASSVERQPEEVQAIEEGFEVFEATGFIAGLLGQGQDPLVLLLEEGELGQAEQSLAKHTPSFLLRPLLGR